MRLGVSHKDHDIEKRKRMKHKFHPCLDIATLSEHYPNDNPMLYKGASWTH